MITITVTGNRGEGKTTTALRIFGVLQMLGMDVSYKGMVKQKSKDFEFMLRDALGSNREDQRRQFVIVDNDTTDDDRKFR